MRPVTNEHAAESIKELVTAVGDLKVEVAVLSTRVTSMEKAVAKAGERGWQVVLAAIPGVAGVCWMALSAIKG